MTLGQLLKKWPLIAFAIIVVCFVILKIFNYYHWPETVITVSNSPIKVLVADTPEHWLKGWSDRPDMGNHDGMLFRFLMRDTHAMVMRDMGFALDIIWLDDGKIVDMAPNVAPEGGRSEAQLTVYRPRLPATAVLELPSGFIAQMGLKIGDTVDLEE
jgi:uncharacterized membrane protein (UPF0127 family)